MTGDRCQGPECFRPAVFGTYCDTHLRQLKRGKPLTAIRPYRRWPELQAYLFESARRLGKATNQTEEEMARRELVRAARVYGMAICRSKERAA